MAETLNEKYKSMVTDNTGTINQMYDAQKQASLSGLESAYNQNLSDATAQIDKINQTYNRGANDLAVQYERQRQNNNLQAAGNGLNVGTGSQMALAQSSNYQRDFGRLRGEQANALTEQDRQINNIKMQYQNAVQQALADNDLARATALTEEYNRQSNQYQNLYKLQYAEEQDALDRQRQAELDAYNREQDAWNQRMKENQLAQQQAENAAALMAQSGDFSGYASLYGLTPAQTSALQAQWMASNPDLAYNSGAMTAEQYRSITGQYPVGYTPPTTGSGSGVTGKTTRVDDVNGIEYTYIPGQGWTYTDYKNNTTGKATSEQAYKGTRIFK